MNVSDKKLWREVKEYVNENYRDYGKWNAYKSALSVKMYKSRGGGYTSRKSSRKSSRNSLKKSGWMKNGDTYLT